MSAPTPISQQHVPPRPAAGPWARLPELLAPAGDWECARAAVENGADAIYFGLEKFNARMRAHNFAEADLPALLSYLHQRGVRGYVTLNTLIFQNELPAAEETVRACLGAGVDALIVQDLGLCRLIRRLSPDIPIHASTQMTVTSAAGVQFARELGCNLVVLARECSIKEIEKIQGALAESAGGPANGILPLEVFVHGALCVAYSGQCFTSEALGGRSANRGECAQACRMPYELISDGQPVELGDRRYLLSPQDLAGLELLGDLARAGVASLKIEGRLKTPEYVASVTRIYRQALDRLGGSSSNNNKTGPQTLPESPPEQDRYELEMAFSRGLYSGWFRGINNQELVHARFGKKRGVFLGEVTRVQRGKIFVRLQSPLKPGDGVVFDAGHPDQVEQGGRVYDVEPGSHPEKTGAETALSFRRGDVDLAQVMRGAKVWKTSDPELTRRLRRSFSAEQLGFRRPITAEVHGRLGQALTLMLRDEAGHVATAQSTQPLARAETQGLTTARLQEQLGRLGGTAFVLEELRNHLEADCILPISELNRLRRAAVTQLESLRAQPPRWTLLTSGPRAVDDGPEGKTESGARKPDQIGTPELIVLVRQPGQLEAAWRSEVTTIYCDFEDAKKYREAVRSVRDANSSGNSAARSIWVAPPRIHKTGEDWILSQVRSCDADGYLVRNYDHLRYFAGCRQRGDFSFNVANALSAAHLREEHGLERLTASYDLNAAQLEALLRAAPPDWFEVTIHQHMPMFHMEHCVFCAFLSQGTDYSNCGRPCDRHELRLRDRAGAEHPVKADLGCRNTVFNAVAQTGAEYVARLRSLGLRHFRIEFVNESPAVVSETIARYRLLLQGELSGSQLWRDLKLLNQLGVTRGSFRQG